MDGARGGWVAACLDASGRTSLRLLDDIDAVAAIRGGATVAIDIPIGLPDGGRACDREARRLLGARRSCVFSPPARYMLAGGGDYGAIRALVAERRAREPGPRGLSAQAAGIVPKVAEVDGWLRRHRDSDGWLFECHPELSFRALNGGAPLAPKTSAGGRARRLKLVREAFPDSAERIAAAGWNALLADVLDAYAALATAVKCARGEHEELGDGTRDGEGLPMRIAV